MLVDSHCHIDFPELVDDFPGVLSRAHECGVGHLLCVSVNLQDFPAMLDLAERSENISASVGVHPNTSLEITEEPSAETLVALANNAKIVAIGETGLDYYRESCDPDSQRERFVRHIKAARRVEKPLIIHTRSAAKDTIELMRKEEARSAGGVMHCFGEDWATAKAALDEGFYISFSGIVTFKNAEALRDVARRVPLNRILVETDSPYLAPVPFRGKTNEPAYVKHTAECLAGLRQIDLEAFSELTTENFFRLFDHAKRGSL